MNGGIAVTPVSSGGLAVRPIVTAEQVPLSDGRSVEEAFANSPSVSAQSAVAVPHTGDLVETVLATITIPAGAMGPNGQVVVETLWSYPTSANNKIQRVRFGGTLVQGMTRTTTQSSQQRVRIANRGAENSQVAQNVGVDGFLAPNAAVTTLAIDTSADVDITITGQLASAGETITLESYIVHLFPSA